MNEVYFLKQRINSLIKKYKGTNYAKEFEQLITDIDKLYNTALINPNSNVLMRFINSIFASQRKPAEQQVDTDKLSKIKERAIQLYTRLLIEYKFKRELQEYEKSITGFSFKKKDFDRFIEAYEKYFGYKIRLRETSEKKIQVYPWKTDRKEVVEQIKSGMEQISKSFFEKNISEEEAVRQGKDSIKEKSKLIKDAFMESDVTYYGSPEFICEKSEFILECMEKIISDEDIKPENKKTTESCIEEARRLVKEIQGYKRSLSDERNYEAYDEMTSRYKVLLEYEDKIAKDIEQIWNEFLTDPKDYEEGQPFAFLVSSFGESVKELEEKNKYCCTLVTEKCMPIPYGNCGYICAFRAENLDTMCIKDAGSWKITKEDFFNGGMNPESQLSNRIGNSDEFVRYENPRTSKLILPTTMEQEMVAKNSGGNRGDVEYRYYTEFFMTTGRNGEKIPILNMFYSDEKGLQQLGKIKNNNYKTPIKIDPSKGTVVQFMNRGNLGRIN